jgi:Spy/CpxP family protein refolding chaperone
MTYQLKKWLLGATLAGATALSAAGWAMGHEGGKTHDPAKMLAQRDSFDATEARKIADEIGQVTGRMVFRASATWSQVYQLLNAEQRAELETLMAKREAHRGKRHKGGGKDAD